MTTLDQALIYLRSGVSVIPIALDGLKAPASHLLPLVYDEGEKREKRKWKPYQLEPVAETVAASWWQGERPPGIAAVCGAVSRNLEVIDFDRDAATIFPLWWEMVEAESPGLPGRCCVHQTPRQPAAFHVWCRCIDVEIPGNLKLASMSKEEEPDGKKRVLIETRGEGGYALLPGSPGECHETGGVYLHLSGPTLPELQPISMDERETLLRVARSFDRQASEESRPTVRPGDDLRPGDHFDRDGFSWSDLLEPAGWKLFKQTASVCYWTRPGKDKGISATTGYCKRAGDGVELFRVFSSNAGPFDSEKAYSKFRVFAMLNANGDWGRAASMLRQFGFGGATRPAAKVVPDISQEPVRDDSSVAGIADLRDAGAQLDWFWPNWIQNGVLAAIGAPGGTGKTRFCADILRRIRHQLPWPDGTAMTLPATARALWVVSDNHHDEMVALCEAFDIVDAVKVNAWKEDPYSGVSLETADDLADLERRIRAVKPCMVVIDTVGNATDLNLCKQEAAKAFYFPLQVIARRYKCAVMCLTHLNADGRFLGRRVLEKVRVAIRLDQPDPDNPKRKLEVYKTNSKRPNPLGCIMGGQGNEYDDAPPSTPSDADKFSGGPKSSKRGPTTEKLEEAKEWLQGKLMGGAAPVGITRKEAEEAGISAQTLYKAKEALSILEVKTQGRLWWSLPTED